MTYNIQVAFDTDRKRTPQRIIREIKEYNHSLSKTGDIFSFTFDLSDFQHAIEILSQVPPNRSVPHLKPYIQHAKADFGELASLSEYFHKFNDEDLKRNTMENIGVGLASLFMNKSFRIDWRDMSHIPKEHFPKGKKVKRADFIGFRGDLRYYFEAKGRTSKSSVSSAITNAKLQLRNIRFTAETKMAFVSYIPCDNLDFPPTLFVSDPPVDEGIDLDINMVRMLHYQNILNYSGFSVTSQTYAKLIRKFTKKKQMEFEGLSNKVSMRPIERSLKTLQKEFDRESTSMEMRTINNSRFIGTSARYETLDEGYTFFRGVNFEIIRKAVILDYTFDQLKDEVIVENGKASIFSDGTILHITRDSDKSKRKSPPLEKTPQESLVYKTPVRYNSNPSFTYSHSYNSNEQKEKEKILVRA